MLETSSKVHREFRTAHEGHLPHAGLDASRASTGVVWCTEQAAEHGYFEEPDLWANLGRMPTYSLFQIFTRYRELMRWCLW